MGRAYPNTIHPEYLNEMRQPTSTNTSRSSSNTTYTQTYNGSSSGQQTSGQSCVNYTTSRQSNQQALDPRWAQPSYSQPYYGGSR